MKIGDLKIVLTGGGTGGHIYPALAIAQALQASGHTNLHYIGHQTGMESRVVPDTGLPFSGLIFSGMPRGLKNCWKLPHWAWQGWQAQQQADQLLQALSPHLIIGTGGYITAPVLRAALRRNIPIALHEPDAMPGRVNRWLAPRASVITVAFATAKTQLKNANIYWTGNPLRLGIEAPTEQALLQPFTHLLIMGGSQGAQKINAAVAEALPVLLDQWPLHVTHQTGAKHHAAYWAQLPECYRNHPRYTCQPFFNDMPTRLSQAQVAVCRAGSMSLSELAASGLASVLVPYPYAAANHQHHNAMAFAEKGAALLLPDGDCCAKTLLAALAPLRQQPQILMNMRREALALAKPHATQEIIQAFLQLG